MIRIVRRKGVSFLGSSALGLAFLFAAACCAEALEVPDSFVLSEIGCDRATGYGMSHKIITWGEKTHVAWLDYDGGYYAKVRTFDHTTGQWSPTYTLGAVQDNHGGPALTIDSQGYLHTAYYPHNGVFRYRKSLNPNDASAWGATSYVGSACTYPALITGPDDTLYLLARESNVSPWVANLYKKPAAGSWSSPVSIFQADVSGYAQFAQCLAWGPDHQTLHLAGRVYDDDSCHAVGYMKSTDFGQTWTQYDGTPITLPATVATWDVIEMIPEEDRHHYASGATLLGGAVDVDPSGVPHVLYNDIDLATWIRRTWLATPNGSGGWDKQLLNDDVTGLPAGWGVAAEAFVIDEQGHMSVVVTASDDTGEPGLWGVPSNELVWLESTDGGTSWTSRWIAEPDPTTPHWLGVIERSAGFNTVDVPSFIYTSGSQTTNDVLWVPLAESIPGDANHDGTVDAEDSSRLALNWGSSNATWEMGDFDKDGTVGPTDVAILAANWGYTAGSESSAPEPSTLFLLLVGALVWLPLRRRNK